VIAAAVALIASACASQVVLRGESTPLDAPIVEVTASGVTVGGDRNQVLPWDRVKLVLGEHEAEARPHMDTANDAWRARVRMERGDFDLACPLFESLFERIRDTPGPTLAGVADGLLRCRMRRGDAGGAVEAWLALRASGAAERAGALVDAETALVPGLPPIWSPDADLRAVAESLDRLASLDRIAALYADAARAQGGEAVQPTPAEARPAEPGAWFVATIVSALSASPESRAEARRALDGVVAAAPDTWREAWARAALGRSLLMESDSASLDRAVAELVHIPARFESRLPRLARTASLLLAREMGRRRDADSASTFARLADDFSVADPLTSPTPEPE